MIVYGTFFHMEIIVRVWGRPCSCEPMKSNVDMDKSQYESNFLGVVCI
jgi:hypothetical protein